MYARLSVVIAPAGELSAVRVAGREPYGVWLVRCIDLEDVAVPLDRLGQLDGDPNPRHQSPLRHPAIVVRHEMQDGTARFSGTPE